MENTKLETFSDRLHGTGKRDLEKEPFTSLCPGNWKRHTS